MSRRGVEISSLTLHPAGIPHGPHPGTAEASIGKEGTEELAVMVDTFHPLNMTAAARRLKTSRTRIRGCRLRTQRPMPRHFLTEDRRRSQTDGRRR